MTVVVLTGATRGIGRAAAIELVRRGAEVVLVGRDPGRVSLVAEEAASVGGGQVHGHVADLALMSNVRVLADEIRGRYQHVDVLANNAGALFASRKETPEGFEQTFALNHLAPFLLTNLLRDRLAGGRVVTTASGAHMSARLDLEDLQSERSYSPRVYGVSKLCKGRGRNSLDGPVCAIPALSHCRAALAQPVEVSNGDAEPGRRARHAPEVGGRGVSGVGDALDRPSAAVPAGCQRRGGSRPRLERADSDAGVG